MNQKKVDGWNGIQSGDVADMLRSPEFMAKLKAGLSVMKPHDAVRIGCMAVGMVCAAVPICAVSWLISQPFRLVGRNQS